MSTWDTNIALAFAAEELLIAVQAITSDALSPERGLGVAHYRVKIVSENGQSLPPGIAARVAVLDASYSDRENSGASDKAGTKAIVAATQKLLSDVQILLVKSQQG